MSKINKIPLDMVNGSVHNTKYGDVVITGYNGAFDVDVMFTETGFKVKAQSGSIRRGNVRDPMSRTCQGIGFIGVGKHKPSVNGIHTPEYTRWYNMLIRCYNKEYQEKFPTYKGCTVCDHWHNFQNFAEWFYDNYPRDGDIYHLDKDIRTDGNKEYSPLSCLFVTPDDNNEKAQAKTYLFKSPEGLKVEVYNVSKFSRENNLNDGHMCAVSLGKRQSHKGWRKWK